MLTLTRDRYGRRRQSAANKFGEPKATAVSESDSDMEEEQKYSDSIPASDTDSQASDQAFRKGARGADECSAPAAVIPMNILLVLMQTLKMASAGPKIERWLFSFDGEEDLTLLLRQFGVMVESNG